MKLPTLQREGGEEEEEVEEEAAVTVKFSTRLILYRSYKMSRK
jgi:hypothetical protein